MNIRPSAASSASGTGRQRIRAASGRIAAEFEPVTAETRRRLARELASAVEGEVRFEDGDRALYATDASNYRQVPLGVVVPHSFADVEATLALARRHRVPIVLRGGGTSLAGEGCNVAVLIDFSKHLDRILLLDPERRRADVEPGCVLDKLRDAAERHRLTFAPDPATHDHNTLGGMIGNNSCGVHSIMAGRTSDNVAELEILTYDGLRMTVGRTSDTDLRRIVAEGGRRAEIYQALDGFRQRYADLIRARYPKIPRRVSGYENLDELLPEHGFNVARALVGTEGTCAVVLRAALDLVPSPPERILVIVGFSDVFAAADAVPDVLGFGPIGLEGIDELLIEFIRRKHVHPDDLRLLPAGQGWLVAEFGGWTTEEALASADKLRAGFEARGCAVRVLRDRQAQHKIWELRESALAATAHVPGMAETWPGWEDSAVPREKLGDYLRDLKGLFHRHGYQASVYGHFGDGLVHCRVPFDLRTESGVADWQHFLEEAAALVARYGGSLSGEHGDGQARAALLETMYGRDLVRAFAEFKAIWDPQGRMNPGKVVAPFPIASNLRIGPDYRPAEVEHILAFPEDGDSFVKATRRCVGVGACRRPDSRKGVMCPSFMVTREEKHSTRGRARLLFEMFHGGPIADGWRSRAVEEALDLCLGCKGCKSDCPVEVDMAAYKAEFRAHHYARRLRPRAAYSMGLIHRWARLASLAPAFVNAACQAPGLSTAMKWAAGIAPPRRMPRFADRTFREWFMRRARPQRPTKARVLLWPDTFNNYFRPQTAMAATRALELLGYEVDIPRKPLCCGRPLYDWGMLDAAKRLWADTLTVLDADIRAGTPIIGLEPACASAFRDELLRLFPGNDRAARLSAQTTFLTEWIARNERDLPGAGLSAAALVQLHCHHHAVIKPDAERHVLDRLGIDYTLASAGCCGMAGSFGFESAKYALSIAAGERALFPMIRAATADTLVVANGFSCREQIEQGTGRPTQHVAELIALALGATSPSLGA